MLPAFGQHFVPNEGQWKEPFSFRWMNNQGAVFIEEQGLSIHLADFSSFEYHHDNRKIDSDLFDMNLIKHHAVKMRLLGGQKGKWNPEDKSESYHNYILGKDPEMWKSNVPIYGSVTHEEI